MAVLAGMVAVGGASLNQEIESRLTAAVSAVRRSAVVTRADGALFIHAYADRCSGGEATRNPGRAAHGLFAAVARLDNRDELGGSLGVSPVELGRTSDARVIRRMYQRWGDVGVARCLGAFAFASWDEQTRRLTLGRDCLGNRPLFFHCGRQFVAFATSLAALFALPDVPRAIDEIALANFMATNFIEQRQTLYRG